MAIGINLNDDDELPWLEDSSMGISSDMKESIWREHMQALEQSNKLFKDIRDRRKARDTEFGL